jgi:hypothetical protein
LGWLAAGLDRRTLSLPTVRRNPRLDEEGRADRRRVDLIEQWTAAASRVEALELRAYISAMTDLTPPEIIAWLDTLPLKDQLMSLHAMTIAIPALQRSQPLKARTAAIRDELRPTAEELGISWEMPADAASGMCGRFQASRAPAERIAAHMIGPRIGNARNDDSALIERLISA